MSVTRSGSSSSSAAAQAARQRAAAEARKKAAAEAAKKAAAEAAKKKAAAEAAKRKDGFDPKKHLESLVKNFAGEKARDLRKLAGGKGTVTENKDGSRTATSSQTKKGTATKQELTTQRTPFGETKLKYEETKTSGERKVKNPTADGPKTEWTRQTKSTFTANTDMLGRATSSQKKETTKRSGDVTSSESRQVDIDMRGNRKVTEGTSRSVEQGATTTTEGSSTTKGAHGTRQKVTEQKVEVKDGATTTTTSRKSTTGTDFSVASSREFKDGTFTLKDSADWKKNSFNTQVSKERERKVKDVASDGGFSQKSNSKLDKAQTLGDIAGAAGLKKTAWEEKKWDTTGKPEEFAAPKFVGTRVGTRGEGKVEYGADGLNANIKREAVAGAYAEATGKREGTYGVASGQAQAKAEAKATASAQAKVNLNGVDASVNLKAGASVEVNAAGSLKSKSVKYGDAEFDVGVTGKARASAEVSAEATGQVKVTRNPPTAVAEGKVGASAVAKAEASIKANAGPFAVTASGYGSAGAEATASGVIGYQDGKLKLGGSAGAALGLGLGGSVQVEVDVKAIGQAAVQAGKDVAKAADVDGDGKLGLSDVGAAASKTASAVSSTVSSAASKVRSWMPW